MEVSEQSNETVETLRSKTHLTMEQIVAQYKIPLSHLKAAKILGASGFNKNNSINWLKLEVWLNEHREEVKELAEQSLAEVKKAIGQRDIILRDIQIANLNGELIKKVEVHNLLKRLSAAQNSLFNSRMGQDLNTKLEGKAFAERTLILDEARKEIVNVMAEELSKWK